jgi:hypothetical protein
LGIHEYFLQSTSTWSVCSCRGKFLGILGFYSSSVSFLSCEPLVSTADVETRGPAQARRRRRRSRRRRRRRGEEEEEEEGGGGGRGRDKP